MHTMVRACGSHVADNTGILMWQNGGSMRREWGGMRREEEGRTQNCLQWSFLDALDDKFQCESTA